jgi:sarcosine oxidase
MPPEAEPDDRERRCRGAQRDRQNRYPKEQLNMVQRSEMADTNHLPPSLWAATAAPAPTTEPLAGEASADVLVIGGGYSGLSAALRAAEHGASVRLLEAGDVGWGAAGRNGGQVIAGLKWDPDELERRYGAEAVDFANGAADEVFRLIRHHGIDCNAEQRGWLQPAHSERALRASEARVEQWARRGAPVELKPGDSVREMVGSDGYVGGMLDHRGGTVQPLSYARGLARAIQQQGGTVHTHSPVVSLERHGGKWHAHTARGSVVADRVVLAANAYVAGLYPRLVRSFISFTSFVVATERLPEEVARTVIPCRLGISDTRRFLTYSRVFDNRLLVGGRGTYHDPTSARDFGHIEAAMARLFPQVRGIPVAYRWSGRIAVMPDFMPRVHEPEPGLAVVHGFSGRGVAQATALGRRLGDWTATGDAGCLPMSTAPIRTIPFHRLQKLYITAGMLVYRTLDALG